MNQPRGFRIRFFKIECKACSWPLCREYPGKEPHIEIKISATVVSLTEWPKYIICGRCQTINTTEDLQSHKDDGERTFADRVKDGAASHS